jgi:predicted XRE-type DNA-binding protein
MQTKYSPFFKTLVEQWLIRIKTAGINQKKLAKLSGVHEDDLSKIMNFKIKNPRVLTMDKVEQSLKNLGV